MTKENYKKNSITLWGAVGLGTGVMVGAAIFALLGQVAELAGSLFPIAYLLGALIAASSSYAYIKMANAYPSAGGIGMFFVQTYGKGAITATASLLMAFSMVISESLIARTFGTYTLQLFHIGPNSFLVPVLGVSLLVFSYLINIANNGIIQTFTSFISLIKIIGLVILALIALKVSNFTIPEVTADHTVNPITGLIASLPLALLSFKGFTTITNNGSEIVKPHKNIGKAIIISISICSVLYLLMAWGVMSSLSIPEIIKAKDYALAQAAKPTLGTLGIWLTVIIAVLSTVTVVIGSVFAVSRMTAMLTKMKLIPHIQLHMKGIMQKQMSVVNG